MTDELRLGVNAPSLKLTDKMQQQVADTMGNLIARKREEEATSKQITFPA